jgi:hypothetical protein
MARLTHLTMPGAVGPESAFSTDVRVGPGSFLTDTKTPTVSLRLSVVDDKGERSA